MEPPLIIKSADFIGAAVKAAQYPHHDLPELAFAGRSNVGKSSLINCLLQRKKLVRTSRTPGRTQTINFFEVNHAFCFVDLPGYGFARVPTAMRASWGPMVQSYLTERKHLRGVVQILDLRHPPTAHDLDLWNWLKDRRIPALAVLTKADKLTRNQAQAHIRQTALVLGLSVDDCIPFSAITGQGRDILWSRLTPVLDLPVEPSAAP